MSKIEWNEPGKRLYESGIDRGVLFVGNNPGVAWNGITGVTETPMTESGVATYQDGVKQSEGYGNDDYKATITAFMYPQEFQLCDGTASLGGGLYMDRQERSRFHLSYRTKIGNDVQGTDFAYKLHLVYNALATPTAKNFVSLSGSVAPAAFTWNITTLPIEVPNMNPSAHFVIDSREVNKFLLQDFEKIIYGTETTAPRMPTIQEIMSLFGQWVTLVITDNGDGTWTAEGPDEVVNFVTETEFFIDWPSAVFLDADSYTVSTA